jgi:hypothetical protein
MARVNNPIFRNIADGDLAFFSTWRPKGTPMKKLAFADIPQMTLSLSARLRLSGGSLKPD